MEAEKQHPETAVAVQSLQMQLSPAAIKQQVQHIQEVMAAVMKEGLDNHYAVIPGCKKLSLLKPGADKLCLTFRLAPSYEIERVDLPDAQREIHITCTLTHIPTGNVMGQGVGSCSGMESKYRWRKAERLCPACGAPAIIKGQKKYGGGWVCWKKKDGCGEKFPDGDESIEGQGTDRIPNTDPADQYNTVLKMAKKRALVDAVLTATAASDIFSQDIEDAPPSDSQPQQRDPRADVDVSERPATPQRISPGQRTALFTAFTAVHDKPTAWLTDAIHALYKIESTNDLSYAQASKLIDAVEHHDFVERVEAQLGTKTEPEETVAPPAEHIDDDDDPPF